MSTFVLTDCAHDLWVDQFRLGPEQLGQPPAPAWSVTKETLRGGRRDGVDLIWLDNGSLAVALLPTRGMNIWRGRAGDLRLGWDSPVRDGPVHPAHVRPEEHGGIGWVAGFDELLARCGLEHNGAPYTQGGVLHPLHGAISNRPAHFVAVHVAEQAPHVITVEAHVDETRLFGPRLRLITRISTQPGTTWAMIEDAILNLGDQPVEAELLYHWNLGRPLLEDGGRVAAPWREVMPRTAHAAEDLSQFDRYGPPTPGLAERVYFTRLHGRSRDGETLVMLANREGDQAVALRFSIDELPCFSLWKNTAGLNDGYVTGLEPGTNYPNPKPYESRQGRVARLDPGSSWTAQTVLEVATSRERVEALDREIETLQQQGRPTVHQAPAEPLVPPS